MVITICKQIMREMKTKDMPRGILKIDFVDCTLLAFETCTSSALDHTKFGRGGVFFYVCLFFSADIDNVAYQ